MSTDAAASPRSGGGSLLYDVRELSRDEVTTLVLPLRLRTLHEEFGWVRREVFGPEDFRDGFDAGAIHLGCFAGERFIGALRLVVAGRADELPSGRHLPVGSVFEGNVCELAKAAVAGPYRGRKVFTRLFEAGVRLAAERGARHLLISVIAIKSTYTRHGFTQIGDPFRYADGLIAPPEDAVLMHAELRP